jgi:hypothetical protein
MNILYFKGFYSVFLFINLLRTYTFILKNASQATPLCLLGDKKK